MLRNIEASWDNSWDTFTFLILVVSLYLEKSIQAILKQRFVKVKGVYNIALVWNVHFSKSWTILNVAAVI